jgi:hypothetical protein
MLLLGDATQRRVRPSMMKRKDLSLSVDLVRYDTAGDGCSLLVNCPRVGDQVHIT